MFRTPRIEDFVGDVSSMNVFWALVLWFRGLCLGRAALATENLALRQQLSVLRRQSRRPQLNDRDRLFWVFMKVLWPRWREVLQIVTPETVVRWHRNGFRYYWRWKSRPKGGRKKVDREIRQLIQRMAHENPTWGAPRIQSELALLGYVVAESTVAKYIPPPSRRPSMGWNTFLSHTSSRDGGHRLLDGSHSDLSTALLFRDLTSRSTTCAARECHGAPQFSLDCATVNRSVSVRPRFLIRDGDKKYGEAVEQRIDNLGIEGIRTSPGSPWQNPFVERFIGSLRRECLNHVIVLSERHLQRIVEDYLAYYHNCRTHLSLQRNAPNPRESVSQGTGHHIIAIPRVGGLHHEYRRVA